jgi:hypothetical protein
MNLRRRSDARSTCLTIALLAMLVSRASGGVAAAPQTDRAVDALSGPVKSVRYEVLKFDTYTGKLDTERMPELEEWYDHEGNQVEEKYHTPDFIDDKHVHRVDPQTCLLKSNMGDKKRHRVYDSRGQLVEETIYTTDGKTWQVLDWSRFKYDAHDRRIETDDIREGKVDGTTLMKRDPDGNLVEMEFHYNGNHAPFPRTWYDSYKFDNHGNWIERHVYDFDPDNGKPARAFTGIDYRVIEYYNDSKSVE